MVKPRANNCKFLQWGWSNQNTPDGRSTLAESYGGRLRMELGCGSYERGVICPTVANLRARARAVGLMLLGGKEPRQSDVRLWDMLLYVDDAPRD